MSQVDQLIKPQQPTTLDQRDNLTSKEVMGSTLPAESPSIRPKELNTELSSKIDSMNADFNKKMKDLLQQLRDNTVRIIDKPYDNIETFIKRITTTQQAKANTPDFTYTVKTDRSVVLKHLSLVPDPAGFISKGNCQIDVADKSSAFASGAGDMTDLGSIDVIKQSSKGFKIPRKNRTINAYVWSQDGTSVSLTVVGLFAWDDLEK